MFDKFEWIVSRYEELSETIVQPEIIADTARYQACLKERAALELQFEAWQKYQALLNAIAQAEEMLADAVCQNLNGSFQILIILANFDLVNGWHFLSG